MNRHQRRNNLSNTFKDYFVPIVGGVLILILLYSFFTGDSSTDTSTDTWENRIGYELIFGDINTEAFIEYENGKKEQVEGSSEIFKWEKLIVKEWDVSLSPWDGVNIKVDRLGELKFNSDGSYSLFSSDVWISNNNPMSVNLRYGVVKTSGKSIVSLSQNEVGSTVYVVSGTAEVSNLGWQSTLLWKWQKITIPRVDAAKDDIDLSLLKAEFDNYFIGSDWFLGNNGPILLQQWSWGISNSTGTGETLSGAGLVSFRNLRDEMRVDSTSIDIDGSINSEDVEKISINNIDVSIDESSNGFILEWFPLNERINDLVIKIFNVNGTILEKDVYTVYTSSISEGEAATTSSSTPVSVGTNSTSGGATYETDATQFAFTAPSSSGKFVTTGSEITIRGITTAKGISKVLVNGFELSSFNGSTWRYHAFTRFDTLVLGTNQYKIDYYDADNKIVYTDYYSIVKKAASAVVTPSPTASTEVISDEADPES